MLLVRVHLSNQQRMPKERKVAVTEITGDQVGPTPRMPETSGHLLRYITTTSLWFSAF